MSRDIRTGRAIVGNPGSIPEMSHIASALARAGLLRSYVTPIAVSESVACPVLRLLPRRLEGRLRRELRRRETPAAVEDQRVYRAASLRELIFVAAQRSTLPTEVQTWLMRHRNVAFDKRMSELLVPTDEAVIATYGASRVTLEAARRLHVKSFLEYPIAHHRFAEAILHEEAQLQPDYAATLQFHEFPARFRSSMEKEIELANYVFVLSQFQRRTFVESGVDESKLIVTPLGVDLDSFRPQQRSHDGKFRILFVGQITQRKGISYLFDAFRRASIPDSELVMVGRISRTDRPWRRLPGVRHVPHVPRMELPAIYRTADVFVLPSLVEGFPQTALEAMACGLPVIISENTFGSDVVTDGRDGFVVPIRDPAAVADHLRYLYEHAGERERIGAAAGERAREFSWERYGDRVVRAVSGEGRDEADEDVLA